MAAIGAQLIGEAELGDLHHPAGRVFRCKIESLVSSNLFAGTAGNSKQGPAGSMAARRCRCEEPVSGNWPR